jgi:hypothetical protein
VQIGVIGGKMKRLFSSCLGVFGALAVAFLGVVAALGADVVLPAGNAPPAIEFSHFPDRLHAFVWRNWGLVEPARLAQVLGTSAGNVEALAASMGLPAHPVVEPEWKSRGYITIIRRNWHLLPYDQLLTLLDMPAARLAEVLREDDFLFPKLGNLKPRCDRLAYAPPDAATSERAARIKRLVSEHFPEPSGPPAEPRFSFLKQFTAPVEHPRPAPPGPLRYIYSYFALFGDPLSDASLDPYPDGLLQQLADRGVNGVWLHVVLRDLAPGGDALPEFGNGHERRLENLRTLVARARRFGIGVYLYTNEPRAMPPEFFKNRPQMAGVREGDHVALCTSDPAVRRWLGDSLAYVFKNVPGLVGVFTITASENLTSCASHFGQANCPRCGKRTGPDVIAEVNATIEEGVHRGDPDAKVIAWDWGWRDEWAGPIIDKLPKTVWLQSVSEWSLPIERGGVKTAVGEYSLSSVGPGPRATRHWALAKKAGLKTVAKVQLNNTWELSALPWLPVLDLVAEHCSNLSNTGVDGMMLSWSLGGYPSPNLDVARRLLTGGRGAPSKDEVLGAVARERYGEKAAPHARAAWKHFSDAFREYPYDGGVVYNCPAQFGPSNLLYAKKTGYAATMIGFPYDDLASWRGPYPAEVFAAQFEKVAAGWDAGLAELKRAAEISDATAAREDHALARAAGLHFRSVANQARFVLARDAGRRDEAIRVARDEATVAKELWKLARRDSRIGFEASNHYYYVPQDLVEKVINCKDVIDQPGGTPPRAR